MSKPSVIPPGGRQLSAEEQAATIADMEALVLRSHLFKSLDDEGRRRLLELAYVASFDAGDEIIRQGDPGEVMFIVISGKVRVRTRSASGEVHLAELSRGACIGEVSVLTGEPRTATVSALTDVDAVAFARHRIERVLAEHPKVRELLLTLVEHRARDTVEKIIR